MASVSIGGAGITISSQVFGDPITIPVPVPADGSGYVSEDPTAPGASIYGGAAGVSGIATVGGSGATVFGNAGVAYAGAIVDGSTQHVAVGAGPVSADVYGVTGEYTVVSAGGQSVTLGQGVVVDPTTGHVFVSQNGVYAGAAVDSNLGAQHVVAGAGPASVDVNGVPGQYTVVSAAGQTVTLGQGAHVDPNAGQVYLGQNGVGYVGVAVDSNTGGAHIVAGNDQGGVDAVAGQYTVVSAGDTTVMLGNGAVVDPTGGKAYVGQDGIGYAGVAVDSNSGGAHVVAGNGEGSVDLMTGQYTVVSAGDTTVRLGNGAVVDPTGGKAYLGQDGVGYVGVAADPASGTTHVVAGGPAGSIDTYSVAGEYTVASIAGVETVAASSNGISADGLTGPLSIPVPGSNLPFGNSAFSMGSGNDTVVEAGRALGMTAVDLGGSHSISGVNSLPVVANSGLGFGSDSVEALKLVGSFAAPIEQHSLVPDLVMPDVSSSAVTSVLSLDDGLTTIELKGIKHLTDKHG